MTTRIICSVWYPMHCSQNKDEKQELRTNPQLLFSMTFQNFCVHGLLPFPQTALHPLKLRHDDNADDDKQRPRTDLADVDDCPGGLLVGVLPGAKERRDVFGDPDEKADQYECH